MKRRRLPSRLGMVLLLLAAATPVSQGGEGLEFNRDIRPILSEYCFRCHGPSSAGREADLRLDVREAALGTGVIQPGDPDASELVRRILAADPDELMPPPSTKKSLSAAQKAQLQQWIAEGANDEPHWSLIALPDQVRVPQPIEDRAWIRNEIDAFVLDRLQREGLKPADETQREQWLRRVTFDLTGLPPTPDEIDSFRADLSDSAYEAVVERLLRSPAYGERMACDWLDAVRYADTFGYQADRDMHVWPCAIG